MPCKNIENNRRAIKHGGIECFFEVACLPRGQLVIKNDQVIPKDFLERFDFFDFARSNEVLRKGVFEALVHGTDDIDICGVNQQRELGQ